MMLRRVLPLIAVLAAAGAVPAGAQAPTATHSVVRLFKCSPQGAGVRWFQRYRPIIGQMIAEGKFRDYGLLAHAWGDEWNVADYFVVDDLGLFFTNFAELLRRAQDADRASPPPPDLRPFDEVCSEHRDVIYRVVPPPSGS